MCNAMHISSGISLNALEFLQRNDYACFLCAFQTGKKASLYPEKLIQVAQLSQRDRAAGWVSNGQKWKTGTERQYLRTI